MILESTIASCHKNVSFFRSRHKKMRIVVCIPDCLSFRQSRGIIAAYACAFCHMWGPAHTRRSTISDKAVRLGLQRRETTWTSMRKRNRSGQSRIYFKLEYGGCLSPTSQGNKQQEQTNLNYTAQVSHRSLSTSVPCCLLPWKVWSDEQLGQARQDHTGWVGNDSCASCAFSRHLLPFDDLHHALCIGTPKNCCILLLNSNTIRYD